MVKWLKTIAVSLKASADNSHKMAVEFIKIVMLSINANVNHVLCRQLTGIIIVFKMMITSTNNVVDTQC
jgi:hypothetical protein